MIILGEYREDIIQRERADMLATIASLEAELQTAEEENERLKCCGSCEHFGSDSYYEFDPRCFAGQWDEEYESLSGQRTIKTSATDYHHHCHFTPSQWTARVEEGA